jgi:hypothetical protein
MDPEYFGQPSAFRGKKCFVFFNFVKFQNKTLVWLIALKQLIVLVMKHLVIVTMQEKNYIQMNQQFYYIKYMLFPQEPVPEVPSQAKQEEPIADDSGMAFQPPPSPGSLSDDTAFPSSVQQRSSTGSMEQENVPDWVPPEYLEKGK